MFAPSDYLIVAQWFPRLLGVIYFFALFPFLFQIRGLIGSKGIQPVEKLLNRYRSMPGWKRFVCFPTIFWLGCSDAWLLGAVSLGIVASLLLALGLLPWLLIPVLIAVHLSVITVGQEFLSFGWEMFFLEISYNAFLLSLTPQPNLLVWVSLNLLIFRFHFQAGASKLISGDPNWKNLTALKYHYQTQPLPHALAWYFHKLPMWFHKMATAFTFLVELAVPFAIVGPEEFRLAAFCFFFLLQFFIILSGNYSYLNYLSIVLVTLLIGDSWLQPVFGSPKAVPATPLPLQVFVSMCATGLIFLQAVNFWNHFFPNAWTRRLVSKTYPFHFANRYGIFAVMTTTRYEIVVKGSNDKEEWKEYLFYYKPSEVGRRPRLISPFHPRLDWQAWFLPFTGYEHESWFQNFLARLLQGESSVLALLRHNPFPNSPPKYMKADIYVYEYSTKNLKKREGSWWVRTLLGSYSPVVSLDKLT